MALLDDVFEGNIGAGLVAALGVAVLGPILAPALRSGAKLAIRGGLVAYDWTRQRAGELGEIAGDLAAEVRAEAAEGASRSGSTKRSSKAG